MFIRKQVLPGSEGESLFLWGARQTGKSTLLKVLYPDALWFDLLLADVYERLLRNPVILRETILADPSVNLVIIDEIQRIPELLNEIHWLMTNTATRFILSGSSPRKIIRSNTNLLGGRALRYELYPLVSTEIPGFDLLKALNHGLLPRHYLSAQPKRLLSAYVGNYLKDEIVSEAKIRNVSVFTRFLEAAAFSNGEMVNYTNIAADCGVSSPTIKEYFQILEDTLIGRFVPVYQKRPKRRVIQASRFYFFDVGIVNHLLKRGKIEQKSEAFGYAFEHFVYQEMYAHSHYSGLDYSISYWRTASQLEIDFVLGDHQAAIEVKASDNITERHLRGLKAFMEEYSVKHAIVVCNEPLPRLHNGIHILPWQVFLQKLWRGEIVS
ncbi:MAG: ATP-binding protein [Chitinophagaceae bacterium]|nr:ATP-binding protein [Chitinophagaceae bacterium]MCW5925704.1 ATP-binding protein [Chitinophagaceae bacterium]